MRPRPLSPRRGIVCAAALLVASLMLSCMFGAMRLPAEVLLATLRTPPGLFDAPEQGAVAWRVLWFIRLPRALLGGLVGAALAMAGGALQSMFRNPLADPGLIGVTSGAALGAVAWIVTGATLANALAAPAMLVRYGVPVAAFLGGLAVCALLMRMATQRGQLDVMTMLLAGIALNAIAGALIGLATYAATEAQLRTLTMWSLGSLGGASWAQVALIAPVVVLGAAALLRDAPALNLLMLGEREAEHLGAPVGRLKRRVVVISALVVGVGVGFTGMIGFIGLVVPHLVRLVLGPDLRGVLPGATLLGATLLILADLAARTLVAPAELPIGVLTALFGAPFFLGLLVQARRSPWSMT